MSRNCVRVPAHLQQKPPKKARSRCSLLIPGAAEQQVREESPQRHLRKCIITAVCELTFSKLTNTQIVNNRGAHSGRSKANFGFVPFIAGGRRLC